MPPKADAIVLFGATGDLAGRMLMPSLFFLDADGRLPDGLRILGVGRSEGSPETFRAQTRALMAARPEPFDPKAWARFAARLDYLATDVTAANALAPLAAALGEASTPIFYLALSPDLFAGVASALASAGLARPGARIVLEKPIGRDLASAQEINDAVGRAFGEDQVFRIDHYLGKETVQNLIALRFANTLFEPLWDARTIDHIQITVAETGGVEERWPYYDAHGALRDMLQNHMLQLLCLVAMEPPSDLAPDSVRNEKVKVLRSLRPLSAKDIAARSVRGQYDGYAEERGAPTDTETFVALEARIDNWRWAGVPFFLRTGKRMAERRTGVVIQFKDVPHSIFGGRGDLTANRLAVDLQPAEDIQLLLMTKAPGIEPGGMRLQSLPLSLSLRDSYEGPGARRRIAYERLLLDVIDGVSTLFVRRDEVEAAWRWVDGVADAWAEARSPLHPYPPGSAGPESSQDLIAAAGRAWLA